MPPANIASGQLMPNKYATTNFVTQKFPSIFSLQPFWVHPNGWSYDCFW
jgi:hypothetical protein